MLKGRIKFTSSNEKWNRGFAWAKEQALAYSHENDLVGDWYEAALPGRQAFCIRDTAHHARGAQALGLENHTKNMLLRFVQNIAESRQFCTFWEIDKDYSPCPVDYKNDRDFWYNLPANFDLIDVCLRMYRMTGDRDYLFQYDFVHFYEVTLKNYVEWWDVDQDGLLERKHQSSRLGIPSYCEDNQFQDAQALIDMLAIEIRGYYSGAEIYGYRGEDEKRKHCLEMAEKLEAMLDEQWWDEKEQKFYQVKDQNGKLVHSEEIGHALSLCYYNVIMDDEKRECHLERLHRTALEKEVNVESLSHYPTLYYHCGQPKRAAYWLDKLISPGLARREYPEVSYAVVEDYIYEMAGILPDAPGEAMQIAPQLPWDISWLRVEHLPFLDGEVDVVLEENRIVVKNRTSKTIEVNGVKIIPEGKETVWVNNREESGYGITGNKV